MEIKEVKILKWETMYHNQIFNMFIHYFHIL
jgi:hypothetical protein